MKNRYVVLFLLLLNSFLLIACGQGTTPTETPLTQISPAPIRTEIPLTTPTPEAVATTTQMLAEPTPAA